MNNQNITNRKFLINTLLTLPYTQLIAQYNPREFFKNVIEQEVGLDLVTLRELLIQDFCPAKINDLSRTQRDTILNIIANADNNLAQNLQAVLPSLKIPPKFDINDYRTRASQINNGLTSIKYFIADEQSAQYLPDVLWFSKLSAEKLAAYLQTAINIIQALTQEYQVLVEKNTLPNQEIINQAIAFISDCGRTPLYASVLKEKTNLGNISEIILKLERALRVAIESKQKTLLDTPDNVRLAIRNYLVKDIHL